jgi:hypothetical protein
MKRVRMTMAVVAFFLACALHDGPHVGRFFDVF